MLTKYCKMTQSAMAPQLKAIHQVVEQIIHILTQIPSRTNYKVKCRNKIGISKKEWNDFIKMNVNSPNKISLRAFQCQLLCLTHHQHQHKTIKASLALLFRLVKKMNYHALQQSFQSIKNKSKSKTLGKLRFKI